MEVEEADWRHPFDEETELHLYYLKDQVSMENSFQFDYWNLHLDVNLPSEREVYEKVSKGREK